MRSKGTATGRTTAFTPATALLATTLLSAALLSSPAHAGASTLPRTQGALSAQLSALGSVGALITFRKAGDPSVRSEAKVTKVHPALIACLLDGRSLSQVTALRGAGEQQLSVITVIVVGERDQTLNARAELIYAQLTQESRERVCAAAWITPRGSS